MSSISSTPVVIQETKKETFDRTDYVDVKDEIKISSIELPELIEKSFSKYISIQVFKDKIRLIGKRKKNMVHNDIEHEIKICPESLPELREIKQHLTDWETVLKKGAEVYNMSALKFLLQERTRNKWYSFETGLWSGEAKVKWQRYVVAIAGSLGLAIVSLITAYFKP